MTRGAHGVRIRGMTAIRAWAIFEVSEGYPVLVRRCATKPIALHTAERLARQGGRVLHIVEEVVPVRVRRPASMTEVDHLYDGRPACGAVVNGGRLK